MLISKANRYSRDAEIRLCARRDTLPMVLIGRLRSMLDHGVAIFSFIDGHSGSPTHTISPSFI